MKIILKAAEIPLNSRVTKRTGEKLYTLRDRIRLFTSEAKPRELLAEAGTFLIVSETGDANVVTAETELVWHAEVEEVRSFIHGLRDGDA